MPHHFKRLEEQLAGLFEILAEQKLGITTRARTRKDLTDGSDLRVDYVYEDARPDPLALEVTSIQTGESSAAFTAGLRLARYLDPLVKQEGLGSWQVNFNSPANVRSLRSEILEILRSRPAGHSFHDPNGRFSLWRGPTTGAHGHGVHFFRWSELGREPNRWVLCRVT